MSCDLVVLKAVLDRLQYVFRHPESEEMHSFFRTATGADLQICKASSLEGSLSIIEAREILSKKRKWGSR